MAQFKKTTHVEGLVNYEEKRLQLHFEVFMQKIQKYPNAQEKVKGRKLVQSILSTQNFVKQNWEYESAPPYMIEIMILLFDRESFVL